MEATRRQGYPGGVDPYPTSCLGRLPKDILLPRPSVFFEAARLARPGEIKPLCLGQGATSKATLFEVSASLLQAVHQQGLTWQLPVNLSRMSLGSV